MGQELDCPSWFHPTKLANQRNGTHRAAHNAKKRADPTLNTSAATGPHKRFWGLLRSVKIGNALWRVVAENDKANKLFDRYSNIW